MYIHYLGTTKEPRFLKMLLHLQENIFKAMFYLLKKVHVSKGEQSEVSQLCPALCGPMDCSLPCSPVRGIFQARVLEWAAISFSRGSSQPRDRTRVSRIVGRRFTIWATRGVSKTGTKLTLRVRRSITNLNGPGWGFQGRACLLPPVHCHWLQRTANAGI